MKKLLFKLIILALIFSVVLGLSACNIDYVGGGHTGTQQQGGNNQGGNNQGGNNQGGNNQGGNPSTPNISNPSIGGNDDARKELYQVAMDLGFEGSFDDYKELIDGDAIYELNSVNGQVEISKWEDSLYKSFYAPHNKNTLKAQPYDGYYFEKWQAYDQHNQPVDTKRLWIENDVYTYSEHDAIGDYVSYNSSIKFVRAIFTNDPNKLVDTKPTEMVLNGDEDSLIISPLPSKIVKNTVIYQTVQPGEEHWITNWSALLPSKIVKNTVIYQTVQPGEEHWITNWSAFYPPMPSDTWGGNIVLNGLRDEEYKCLVIRYDHTSVLTNRNNSFGTPTSFTFKTQKRSDVIAVISTYSSLQPSKMPYQAGGDFGFNPPSQIGNRNIDFVTKGNGVYLSSSGMGEYEFNGWYDFEGNLLSDSFAYIDEDFEGDEIYIQYRITGFDVRMYDGSFSEATKNLRFNPIEDGTAWEVCYNYENTEFVDVLEIPATYKGLPVTRIADRGFAKFWIRNESELGQWWFFQAHPSIGKLIVPATILEVGDKAFASIRNNGSNDSLTTIAVDTDGNGWYDYYKDITFEIEFLSAETKVSLYTFAQSGHKFINIEAQIEQLLNDLLDMYVDGVDELSLNIFTESVGMGASGYYSLENPTTINVSADLFDEYEGRLFYTVFHEFRHFMQFVSAGLVQGASLKNDIGERYVSLVEQNLQNYINASDDYYEYTRQFVEADADAFAYSLFGYYNFSSLMVRL